MARRRLAVVRDADDDHPHELAELGRRESHAAGVRAHRLQQVRSHRLNQLSFGRRSSGRLQRKLARDLLERRMGKDEHVANGHRFALLAVA